MPAVSIGLPNRTVTVTGLITKLPLLSASRAPVIAVGHDRRLPLDSHDKASLLERQQTSCPAPRALGEDQKGVPLTQRLGGAIDGRKALLGVGALERDETSEVPGAHQNRQLAQLCLIQHPKPGKDRRESVKEDRRFDVAGVVHGIDRGAVAQHVFASFDPHLHTTQRKSETDAEVPDAIQQRNLLEEDGDEKEGGTGERHVRRDGDVRGDRSTRLIPALAIPVD